MTQITLSLFCTAITIVAVIVVIRSTRKINKATGQVGEAFDDLARRVDRLERAGE